MSRWPRINIKLAMTNHLTDCIGLHLAQIELRLATTLFFRTYPNAKVSAREEFTEDDMKQKVYFLMFPKGKRCLIEGS